MRGFDQFGTIPAENDSYEILIKNSSKVIIASILWKIGFNADPDSAVTVGETFRVNFTNPGNLHLYRNSAKYLRINEKT